MITIPIAWLAPYIPKLLLWVLLCAISALIVTIPDDCNDSVKVGSALLWIIICIIMFVLMFTNLIVFV